MWHVRTLDALVREYDCEQDTADEMPGLEYSSGEDCTKSPAPAPAVILATHYKRSIAVHVRHFTFIPTPRAGFDCDFGIVQLATPFKKVSQARSTPFKKGLQFGWYA